VNGKFSNDLLVGALADAIASALTKQLLPELKQHLSDCLTSVSAGEPRDPPRRDGWLSTSQAAAVANVAAKTVANWIRSGKLPATRPAGTKQYLVTQADLEKFLAAGSPQKQGRSRADEERVLRALGL
jgi:excisionase family DNA binding protein